MNDIQEESFSPLPHVMHVCVYEVGVQEKKALSRKSFFVTVDFVAADLRQFTA